MVFIKGWLTEAIEHLEFYFTFVLGLNNWNSNACPS